MKNLIKAVFISSLLLLISCSKENSDPNKIMNLITEQMSNHDIFFYNNFFIKNKLKKQSNFLTREELLKKRIDDFYYPYKPIIKNNEATISFLKIKNGKMYTFYLLKKDKWNIIKKDSSQTKVEENEGTRLYYQIENLKQNK